jgi:hypothetical protein
MTPQGNGPQRLYDVRMSEQTRSTLEQLHLRARAAGRNKHFLSALRRIIERLQKEPLTLGEPLYRLPALGLLVCQAVVDFVVVDYAVHDQKPLVFIRGFRLLV